MQAEVKKLGSNKIKTLSIKRWHFDKTFSSKTPVILYSVYRSY